MANFLTTLTGMGIDKVCNGIGSLAKDMKEVFTGKASPETIAKAKMQFEQLELQAAELKIREKKMQTDIITAEANSESVLARTWRPLVMLSFGLIIFNDALIVPYIDLFLEAKLDDMFVVSDHVWTAITLGLSGYVVGRSAEKVIDKVKNGKKN